MTDWGAKRVSAVLSFIFLFQFVHADVYLFSDYDGTVFADREGPGQKTGAWITYYKLFRVDSTSHPMIAPSSLTEPSTIDISHVDYENYKKMLAQDEGHSGHTGRVPLHSGSKADFIPGHYRLISPLSYENYRMLDWSPEVNALSEFPLARDFSIAQSRLLKNDSLVLEGYGHALLTHFLSDPSLAAGTRILTARGGDVAGWSGFFQQLQSLGMFKEIPEQGTNEMPKGFIPLGSSILSHRYGSNVAYKKVTMIERKVYQLKGKTAAETVLNPNGDGYGHYHTIVFAEDNPEYLLAVQKLAREITMSGIVRVKFVLLNTAPQSELFETRWPTQNRAVVVTGFGGVRDALEEEYFVPLPVAQLANHELISNRLARSACERMLL